MHKASLINLAHGRIYQWVTRFAFAPRAKQGFIVWERQAVKVWFKRTANGYMRIVIQNLKVKITPNKLI